MARGGAGGREGQAGVESSWSAGEVRGRGGAACALGRVRQAERHGDAAGEPGAPGRLHVVRPRRRIYRHPRPSAFVCAPAPGRDVTGALRAAPGPAELRGTERARGPPASVAKCRSVSALDTGGCSGRSGAWCCSQCVGSAPLPPADVGAAGGAAHRRRAGPAPCGLRLAAGAWCTSFATPTAPDRMSWYLQRTDLTAGKGAPSQRLSWPAKDHCMRVAALVHICCCRGHSTRTLASGRPLQQQAGPRSAQCA